MDGVCRCAEQQKNSISKVKSFKFYKIEFIYLLTKADKTKYKKKC